MTIDAVGTELAIFSVKSRWATRGDGVGVPRKTQVTGESGDCILERCNSASGKWVF